jgi:hypothetical protein
LILPNVANVDGIGDFAIFFRAVQNTRFRKKDKDCQLLLEIMADWRNKTKRFFYDEVSIYPRSPYGAAKFMVLDY